MHMPRKTVAITGLIVVVAASLLVVESQRPGTRAAASVSGSPAADAYLPFISKEKPPVPSLTPQPNCSPCYPDVCIPAPPPDLDCGEIPFCRFRVVGCDPHGFDGDGDGIGCERCYRE